MRLIAAGTDRLCAGRLHGGRRGTRQREPAVKVVSLVHQHTLSAEFAVAAARSVRQGSRRKKIGDYRRLHHPGDVPALRTRRWIRCEERHVRAATPRRARSSAAGGWTPSGSSRSACRCSRPSPRRRSCLPLREVLPVADGYRHRRLRREDQERPRAGEGVRRRVNKGLAFSLAHPEEAGRIIHGPSRSPTPRWPRPSCGS